MDEFDKWLMKNEVVLPRKNPDEPRLSSEEIARRIRNECEESREAILKHLRVGNLQILHVVPEITQVDTKFEFDTDIFMKSCHWARNDVVKFTNLKNWENGFYIFGQTGCGKTIFLKAKALELANRDSLFNADYVKFVNLGKLVNDLGKDNWAYKSYILEELRRCTHLFIDDIGTETGSQWHEQILTEILDNRIFKRDKKGEPKTTSFSSNRKPSDLPYHARVIRRIEDMAAVIQVAPLDNENTTAEKNMNEARKGF